MTQEGRPANGNEFFLHCEVTVVSCAASTWCHHGKVFLDCLGSPSRGTQHGLRSRTTLQNWSSIGGRNSRPGWPGCHSVREGVRCQLIEKKALGGGSLAAAGEARRGWRVFVASQVRALSDGWRTGAKHEIKGLGTGATNAGSAATECLSWPACFCHAEKLKRAPFQPGSSRPRAGGPMASS